MTSIFYTKAIFHTRDGCVRTVDVQYPPPKTFLLPLMHPVVTMLSKEEGLLTNAWTETRAYDLDTVTNGEAHYIERNTKEGT